MPKPPETTTEPRWLLLIHQIPPKPDYLRVKVGRRLARIGAVAVKNSVYVLPVGDQAVEDFDWVVREIADAGGEASFCRATFVNGLSDAEIERLFRDARSADYRQVATEARATLKTLAGRKIGAEVRSAAEHGLSRLRKRIAAVERIDFYASEDREDARELLDQIAARLHPGAPGAKARPGAVDRSAVRGRTWVTRPGVFVDRMASAWLIRRFIDPDARFKFVGARQQRAYRPNPGELRFDMFEAEYTHRGDQCTFETLVRAFELDDPALASIAEVVHDIDLRDAKFARDDTAGIERVIAGIAASHADDAERLERGAALFDDLYGLALREAAQRRTGTPVTARRARRAKRRRAAE